MIQFKVLRKKYLPERRNLNCYGEQTHFLATNKIRVCTRFL